MGHRANLALVEHGQVSVRYDHWAAHDLNIHLVLGPEYTLHWVRRQESVDHAPGGGWLSEVFCEGGLTMDLDRRRLTWFDSPTGYDLARREVIVALLARTWPGWTVERATGGAHGLAVAAGVPVDRVVDPDVVDPDVVDLITATPPRGVGLREDPFGSGRWCPAGGEPDHCLVTVARRG